MCTTRRGPRAFLHRLHTIAGIVVAPFLIIAAITGFAYALAPTAEKIVYHDEMTAASGLPTQSVEKQVRAASDLHRGLEVTAVQVANDPTRTTRVLFDDPDLKSDSYRHAVFVDPGDLSIKGDLVQYGSTGALPLRTWISEGHRRLWSDNNLGRLYSELAASWLGALTLVGLWLWWDRNRRGRTNGATVRSRHMRKHARLGVIMAIGFFFLTASGLTWSWVAGTQIGELRSKLNWYAPTPAVAETPAEYYDWGQADRVVAAAREAGLSRTIEIKPPIELAHWSVSEARQEWRMDMDSVIVDGSTGRIIDSVSFDEWPLPAKLTEWIINAHIGILFGWFNQLLLAALAVGLLIITARGLIMWWMRGKGNRPGRLPVPTRWRDLSRGTVVGLTAFVAISSLIAPLFGISLAAFAIVDSIWQAVRSRTTSTIPADAT